MKIKHILPGFMTVALMATLTGCIDDSSTYGGQPIPELTVITSETDPDKMPEVNFNYGENCVITPQVHYDGTGKLEYEWSIGTYDNNAKGELEVVSHEPVLTYFFHKGGSYYAHLKITDGTVGVVQEYQVNINRTFEQGYLIISNDSRNVGNLAFIKDLTSEEIEAGISPIVMEHCLERVNENLGEDNIAGATVMRMSWPADITRIVVTCGSKTLFIDPNTFISITTIDHSNVIPGFKANMLVGGTNALAFDPNLQRFITIRGADMLGVESSEQRDPFDTFFTGSYYAYGTQYYHNYFVKRSPLEIWHQGYAGRVDAGDLTDNDGYSILRNQELVNIFMGESEQYYQDYPEYGFGMWVSYYPGYVITKDMNTGKYFCTKLRGFSPNDTDIELVSRMEIPCTSETAIPATESPMAVSATYHRVYYSNGNRVYVMLIDESKVNWPNVSQAALTYPEDEEVTFMTVNSSSDELIVATANKQTGRGSVYIYDSANVRTDLPDATATAQYKNCADRISNIFYKPRVAN